MATPVCKGHGLACKKQQVRKAGPNSGRFFWGCPLYGDQRCSQFAWATDGAAPSLPATPPSAGSPRSHVAPTVDVELCSAAEARLVVSGSLPASVRQVLLAHGRVEADRGGGNSFVVPVSEMSTVERALQGAAVTLHGVPECVLRAVRATPVASQRVPSAPDCAAAIERAIPLLWRRLFVFQRDAVVRVVQHRGKFLIGDEMGLGKTITAIAVVRFRHHQLCVCSMPLTCGVAQTAYFKLLPVLVICPSSVKLKYVIETHKHTHILYICSQTHTQLVF